jgi:hypothetical protein
VVVVEGGVGGRSGLVVRGERPGRDAGDGDKALVAGGFRCRGCGGGDKSRCDEGRGRSGGHAPCGGEMCGDGGRPPHGRARPAIALRQQLLLVVVLLRQQWLQHHQLLRVVVVFVVVVLAMVVEVVEMDEELACGGGLAGGRVAVCCC